MIVLRALGALLSYPRDELRAGLPEIAEVIASSPLIAAREREGLIALIDELGAGDLLGKEERYVELFDRGRATSLNLFEHLHGDGRERGAAMIDLKQVYERAGFDLATTEMPDFLPVLLEYLSWRDLAEARATLNDCAHILKSVAQALIARRAGYASVLQALIVIAGEAPVEAASVVKFGAPAENLDRDWVEPPAFGGSPQPRAAAP